MPASATSKLTTTTVSPRLKGLKIVAVTGMIPIVDSRKWPGVATSSGAEAESPACHVAPIPKYAAQTSNR